MTRVFSFLKERALSSEHLTEIQLQKLVDLQGANSPEQTAGMMSGLAHLRECSACAALVEGYRNAGRKIDSVKSLAIVVDRSKCPPEEVWLELVAGIVQEKEAMDLLRHCSECQACAQLLKEAEDGLEEEVVEAESASPEWQLKMAQRMAAQVAVSREQQRRKLTLWVPLGASAAAAAVVAIVLFSLPKPPDVEQTLAVAYSDERTLPLRIAGAQHAKLKQRREANQRSLFDTNAQMVKAQNAVSTLCKRDPEGAECLLTQAELNLLDWRYQPALTNLNKIKPELRDSEKYLLVHAIAVFEQAELSGSDPDLLGHAVSDLTKILQSNPHDAVALFNRALIYEKLNWMENAAADWLAFLSIEKDPGWREEAQQHLDLIQQKKNRASRA